MIGGPKRSTVSTTAFTQTVHHVEVDLTEVLAGFDPTEQVFLLIQTPSGRGKRVHIPANLLVEQRQDY